MHPKSPVEIEPELVTVQDWMRISGDARSTVYEKLGDGRLRAFKDGNRTKIDLQYGREHLRSLPPARIKPVTKKIRIAPLKT